jgi:hypothetical protein
MILVNGKHSSMVSDMYAERSEVGDVAFREPGNTAGKSWISNMVRLEDKGAHSEIQVEFQSVIWSVSMTFPDEIQ